MWSDIIILNIYQTFVIVVVFDDFGLTFNTITLNPEYNSTDINHVRFLNYVYYSFLNV